MLSMQVMEELSGVAGEQERQQQCGSRPCMVYSAWCLDSYFEDLIFLYGLVVY